VSALPDELTRDDTTGESSDRTETESAPVVVRRNAGLAALIGAGASTIAIGYLWRASQSGSLVDWALCLVMAMIAGFYLSNLVDSRTPLLVADDLGVRIRLGNEWRGLPWDAVNQVVVEPRRGPLRDGRLIFSPRSLGRALDGLEVRGRRQAALNQRLYGAALAVPLGLTTRVSTQGTQGLEAGLAALALGRADVVVLEPPAAEESARTGAAAETEETPEDTLAPAAPDLDDDTEDEADDEPEAASGEDFDDAFEDPSEDTAPVATAAAPGDADVDPDADAGAQPARARRSMLGGLGTVVSRVAKGRSHDVDVEHDDELDDLELDTDLSAELPAAVPLRSTRPALRAEITREVPATPLNGAPDELPPPGVPEGRELHRPGSVDLIIETAGAPRVRPISQIGEPVEPLVIDDFVTEPAYDPVIGPELAAARTRLGLSVDELAERTRIRPHVIESIEVDDFAPCGGDFYARGHLRTLARVLGTDVTPLLAKFDDRYATAPINAKRVFEAELAAGMTGSMRSTIGGPSWGLLVVVVLVLGLVWGAVRLFAGQPAEQIQSPAPVVHGAAGVSHSFDTFPAVPAHKPMRVTLVAAQADSHVVVRDGEGTVVYAGLLVLGETKSLEVTPPVHVSARNAGAVEVKAHGKDLGPVGALDQPGARTLHRP
jgi:transcriptional regulator with XRE-family HTH domain